LSAEFEEPTMFTAQAEVDQDIEDGVSCFAYMTVEWTVNGITQSRTIDVCAGASISGLAEACRILVKDGTAAPFPPGFKYGVTANVAARTRPRTAAYPVFTALRSTLLPAGTSLPALVDIPEGANSVAVFSSTTTGPADIVLVQQALYPPAEIVTLMSTSITPGIYVPLLAGALGIGVSNAGAADASVTVVFGIDG
jgi:hypothetical protein